MSDEALEVPHELRLEHPPAHIARPQPEGRVPEVLQAIRAVEVVLPLQFMPQSGGRSTESARRRREQTQKELLIVDAIRASSLAAVLEDESFHMVIELLNAALPDCLEEVLE